MKKLEDYLYYETKLGKLFLGDSLEILPLLENNSIDLVLTDPPYNISSENKMTKRGNKFTTAIFGDWDMREKADFLSWINDIYIELFKICKESSAVYMFSDKALVSHIWDIAEHNGFKCKNILVWHKTNPVPQFRKQNYLSSTEVFVWVVKGVHKLNFLEQKEMHNFIEMPLCSGKDRTEHTTQKPIKLIEKYLLISSNRNDLVIDPFLGSGTTALACEKLGRRWIGIEISDTYAEIAKQRIKAEYDKLKLDFS